MKMEVLIAMAAILIVNFQMSECQSCAPFDSTGTDHTMCKYQDNSGCEKLSRGVSQAEIDEIITTHNILRQKVANGQEANQPSAANMKQMKWNDELAAIAQRWADQCTFGHDENRNTQTFPYVGQNVAIAWSSAETNNLAEFKNSAIDPWYGEVSDFSPNNIDPFVFSTDTGHYTQVVWAESTDVGCGYAYYLSDGQYTKLYVCNYGPGGNVISTSMYKQGQSCSECTDGCSTAYPGLCN